MKTHGWFSSRLLHVVFSGLLLTGAPCALSAQSTADVGLQPGDKVIVTVWQRDELSGEFTVAPDGSLNHPLYRQVQVMGVPAAQVEERLRGFLSAYEANPQVVVQPLYKVAVVGAVMVPDIYDLPPGTTISQAVTQAGGVTQNGKRDDVVLFRSGNETELDLTEVEAIRMPVQSGDQIMIKDKSSVSGFRSVALPLIQTAMTLANLVYWINR